MSGVRVADLLAFVHELGAAGQAEAFRRIALAGLLRLVGCDFVSFNDIGRRGLRAVAGAGPTVAGYGEVVAPFQRLLWQNPLIAYYVRSGDQQAHVLSEFVGRSEFQRTALYQEVHRPRGMEHQLAVPLPSRRGTVIGFALNRGRPDFTLRDRNLLNLLQPHLAHAWRLARRTERAAPAGGGAALAGRTVGAVEVDTGGRVRASGPEADLLLRAMRSAWLVEGLPLHGPIADWLRSERERAKDPSLPPRPLALTSAGERLTVSRRPDPNGRGGSELVFVLSHAWRLTGREADVLRLLAAGAANGDIADALRLSTRTVAKHLEHIYLKLGVHSRTEAVARLWKEAVSPQ